MFESDREAVENALNCIGLTPPEQARVVRIRSTLVLGEIECSEALLPEIAKRPDLEVVGPGRPLPFDAAGRIVSAARSLSGRRRGLPPGALVLDSSARAA